MSVMAIYEAERSPALDQRPRTLHIINRGISERGAAHVHRQAWRSHQRPGLNRAARSQVPRYLGRYFVLAEGNVR